jgi:hypothetical protein
VGTELVDSLYPKLKLVDRKTFMTQWTLEKLPTAFFAMNAEAGQFGW